MNVLITSTLFIPSVLLCGHIQLEYLQSIKKVQYKFVQSHFISQKNVEWADIIIFLRSDSDIDFYVSKYAKKVGKRLVYVLDDDILHVPSYLSSAPYYLLPSTQKNIKGIMSNCDIFLTTSKVLMKKYGSYFQKCYLIDEPSINRILNKEENSKIKIGFAGSIDRAQDLGEILGETIRIIKEKYKDKIEIEIMGAKPAFIEELNLKHLPYQDGYDKYTAFMSKCNWDIGLAPMPISEFHRCKYFNKFVEYASFGIAGIYTNCEPYIYGIEDRINGLLVNNTTEEWVNAISELIENKELRTRISNESLKQASTMYSLEKLAEDYYEKIVDEFVPIDNHSKFKLFYFYKFIIFFKRVYRKIKEHGLNFPCWLIKKLQEKKNIWVQNRKDDKNLGILKSVLEKKKTIFIFSNQTISDVKSKSQSVRRADNDLKNITKIYLYGEDRLTEHLKVEIINENHINIVYNGFDTEQVKLILQIIQKSGNCLLQGIEEFMGNRISVDIFKIFDLGINILYECCGNIPEKYHASRNYHTEQVLNVIEAMFYKESNVLIYENEKIKDVLISKYGNRKELIYTCFPGNDINRLIK